MANSNDSSISNPLFFVITTLYNSQKTIEKTLESMLGQTSSNFVHYIYDDGSPENCDALIEEYIQEVGKRSRPYKVIYEKGRKNLGVDGAHIYCFKKIDLPFFTWLDSGNVVTPCYFAEFEKAISAHPDYAIYQADYFPYPQASRRLHPVSASLDKKNFVREDILPNLCSATNIVCEMVIINLKRYQNINPAWLFLPNKEYGGFYYDSQILFELAAAGERRYFIDKPLSYVLCDPHSASTAFRLNPKLIAQGESQLLKTLNFSSARRGFVLEYLSFLELVEAIPSLCLTSREKDAIETYQEALEFIAEKKLPSYYFPLQKNKRRFYWLAKHPHWLHWYKKMKKR